MDATQLPELLDKSGYPVMMEAYEAQPNMYRQIADVRPIPEDELYGTKWRKITGAGRLLERLDGAEIEADEVRSGPVVYIRNRLFSRRLDIPDRMLRNSNAAGKIGGLMARWSQSIGQHASLQLDEYVADVLQKGTLTAGSQEFFDNSFLDEADPNPLFIYDGLPFFDTAHTITVGSSTFANHTASLALSEANLSTVVTTMKSTNNRDERDERIIVRPRQLIVPPGLERTARTILGSDLLPGGGNNDVNTMRASLDLVVWDALDDAASAAAWWVSAGFGLVVHDSGAPVMELGYDDKKKVHYVTAEKSWGCTVEDWRGFYCANKAAS